MKRLFYKYTLIALALLIQSCKAQVSTASTPKVKKEQEQVVDSVSYEIITDSLTCEDKNNPYRFSYVKIKHEDKTIEEKLNSSLLTINWKEVRSLESYEETLYDLREYLNGIYCESPIDTNEVYVVYNNNYYLTIEYQNNDWYRSLFNFDLKTGELLSSADVFINIREIYKIIEDKVKKELVDLMSKEKDEDIRFNLQNIYKSFKCEKVDLWGFGIENDGLPLLSNGIYFLVYVENPYPIRYIQPNNYFLSFKELEPYLTEHFKIQIGLND